VFVEESQISSKKNVNLVQQQLELIISKLDFLTSAISKKYPSSFVFNQEFCQCNCSFEMCPIEEDDHVDFVAHTYLKALDSCLWYLDSACSKHMSRDKSCQH
jgi:hypothetical protein